MPFPRLPVFRYGWPRWWADARLRYAFEARGTPPQRNHGAMAYWLRAGANPNQQRFGEGDSWVLLHVAAEEGDTQAVELLLAHGAVIDPIATPHRETPLAMALRAKHRAAAEALARAGANLAHNCRFSYSKSERATLEGDWFRLYPTSRYGARQSFKVQSHYRVTNPQSPSPLSSLHSPRSQASVEDLSLGCVDRAKALAFTRGGVCEPSVRALMHNVGWEDLIEISKSCDRGRKLESAWSSEETPSPSMPPPSRARL